MCFSVLGRNLDGICFGGDVYLKLEWLEREVGRLSMMWRDCDVCVRGWVAVVNGFFRVGKDVWLGSNWDRLSGVMMRILSRCSDRLKRMVVVDFMGREVFLERLLVGYVVMVRTDRFFGGYGETEV